MKLFLSEVIEILQKEIEWCLDNPYFASDKDRELSVELTKEEQMGFMNGLRQAQYLIKAAENLL